MDLMPEYNKQSQKYLADIAIENQNRPMQPPLDPDLDYVFEQWLTREREIQTHEFPLIENLTVLIFIVVSDLTEQQRERLQSTLTQRGYKVENYSFQPVKEAFRELFCAPRSSLENPSFRASGQSNRSFCVLEDGDMDGLS